MVDGNVVILDLRSGSYRILDDVASCIWQGLTTDLPRSGCIDLVLDQFSASPREVAADFNAFVASAETTGLITSHHSGIPERDDIRDRVRAARGILGAWLMLFGTRRHLAKRGFARLYDDLARRAKPAVDPAAAADRLASASRAFARAENLFVATEAQRDCLPRSLSLYRWLLASGVACDHVIGVRRFPFQAHAWVECQNQVLFDSQEVVESYAELARL